MRSDLGGYANLPSWKEVYVCRNQRDGYVRSPYMNPGSILLGDSLYNDVQGMKYFKETTSPGILFFVFTPPQLRAQGRLLQTLLTAVV